MNQGADAQTIQRLLQMKRALRNNAPDLTAGPAHECIKGGECRPENEPMMFERSSAQGCRWPGQPLTNHIYVCEYGRVHVCTDEHCSGTTITDDFDILCEISGKIFGQDASGVAKNMAPHWGSASSKQQRPLAAATPAPLFGGVRNIPSQRAVRDKVSAMVHKLLYGPERKRLADAQQAACVSDCESALARYELEHSRQNQFCNLVEQVIIATNALSHSRYCIVVLPYNAQRIEYYADIVVQVWERCLEFLVGTGPRGEATRAKPNVECIALAVLYFMQTGYRLHGIEMLPYDEYLCAYLPRSSDLHAFGIDKRHDTTGTKLVIEMYDNAMEQQIELARIQLQFAPAEATQVGEKLYMPTSLRKHL